MGGNALKNCKTKRLQADEYFAIEKEVCALLRDSFNDSNGGYMRRAVPILAYKTKKDFGDLDVIFESNRLGNDFLPRLKELFKSKEMVPNGKVISLEYKEFQVDVILTPSHEMQFAEHYYAFNDLGNLMGRIAHKMGMKYGHNGLWYMFRDGTHLIDEINVSMDIKKVFKFLDFDYERWTQGFNDLEEIFEYVSQSKFFNPGIYLFDQMNHRSRVRDAKRATYNSFLAWCETKRNNEWKNRKFFEWSKDKSVYLPELFETFPQFENDWMDAYHKMLVNRDIKNRFSGEIVREVTGLDGKELGEFIKHFKGVVNSRSPFKSKVEPDNIASNFTTWVIASSKEMIEAFILEQFEQFKQR